MTKPRSPDAQALRSPLFRQRIKPGKKPEPDDSCTDCGQAPEDCACISDRQNREETYV